MLCGKLWCHGGNDNPNYGRMVSISDCKASFFAEYTADYGQVDSGTTCAKGKVCNHRAECQCEPGWVPPTCDSKDPSFSTASKAVTISAVVVSLVVLGVIVVAMALLYRRKKNGTLPTVNPQKKTRAADNPGFRGNIGTPSQSRIPPMQAHRPKAAPPPPPPAGNRPKPTPPSYVAARQALRPVPPPKV
ncbi:hypothetical protein CRUP_021049 [Coryphaenoides rupestris]|nr:hypothetical protein CRUP_021049 [Coryphaenoides rupestris]